MNRLARGLAVLLLAAPAAAESAADDRARFDPLADAALEPKLGATVPLDAAFRDESGAWVTLADYLRGGGGEPVILAPVDYDCRNLCGISLGDLFGALGEVPFTAGDAFEVVAVSIDPREGPADADAAKAEHMARYTRPGAEAGVHFLTAPGDKDAIDVVADAIGFRYRYDPETDQYAHPAGVGVLTPDGRLARWLYGFPYEPDDLRLALTEASAGEVGTLADRVWLLCYAYDPVTGSYTPTIWAGIRAAGALGVLALGGTIVAMLRRERRRDDHRAAP